MELEVNEVINSHHFLFLNNIEKVQKNKDLDMQ